jgi:glycosyltransferase involved in cell wall biosynthesis
MSFKISIIVPCYNIEKYLSRCIESVLEQTHTNFELLLLDDGSNDSTLDICNDFKKKDSRVKVFVHDNKGVSYTRNRGIREAQGELIMFVDGDDYLEPNYIETHVQHYKQGTIVISGFLNEKGEEIIENINFKRCLGTSDFKMFLQHNLLKLIEHDALSTPCCKLYDLKLIQFNSIFFDEHLTYQEDLLFNLAYFSYFNEYKLLRYFGYHYISNSGSSTSRFHQNFKYTRILYEKLLPYVKEDGDNLLLKEFLFQTLLRRLANVFHKDNPNSLFKKNQEVSQVVNSIEYNYSVGIVNQLPINTLFTMLLQLKNSFLITLYFKTRELFLS